VIVVADRKTAAESSALFFQHQEEKRNRVTGPVNVYKGREVARDYATPGNQVFMVIACVSSSFRSLLGPWKSVEGIKVGA
jgi:hypothetical protein